MALTVPMWGIVGESKGFHHEGKIIDVIFKSISPSFFCSAEQAVLWAHAYIGVDTRLKYTPQGDPRAGKVPTGTMPPARLKELKKISGDGAPLSQSTGSNLWFRVASAE